MLIWVYANLILVKWPCIKLIGNNNVTGQTRHAWLDCHLCPHVPTSLKRLDSLMVFPLLVFKMSFLKDQPLLSPPTTSTTKSRKFFKLKNWFRIKSCQFGGCPVFPVAESPYAWPIKVTKSFSSGRTSQQVLTLWSQRKVWPLPPTSHSFTRL